MDVFATLIFFIVFSDPGSLDSTTNNIALKMLRHMLNKVETGLTRVAILGRIGFFRADVEVADRKRSVRMN